MARLCPRCGKPVLHGACPRCGAGGKSRRTPEQERRRRQEHPERARYSSAAYKKACQAALSRTGGLCQISGVRVADRVGGRWVMRKNGGVHHIVPIAEGGTDDPSNLMPLDVAVHNRIDAELRRKRKGKGKG